MELFDVPAKSLAAFEKIHDLRVTVHDLTDRLWSFLLPERFRHSMPQCQAIKRSGKEVHCLQFENEALRRDLPTQPAGRVHRCHAGFIEWVVPIFGQSTGALELVLFAGIRSAGPGLAFLDHPRSLPVLNVSVPPPVTEEQSQLILEHLRQLAARLKHFMADYDALKSRPNPSASQRHTEIRRFIINRHTEPVRLADLAAELGLTESRTSHVVRESCNQTFRDLLVEARLRTAMGLLRRSDIPVIDIAARSGFEDLRHFHRLFKRRTGETPHRYRRLRGEP